MFAQDIARLSSCLGFGNKLYIKKYILPSEIEGLQYTYDEPGYEELYMLSITDTMECGMLSHKLTCKFRFCVLYGLQERLSLSAAVRPRLLFQLSLK